MSQHLLLPRVCVANPWLGALAGDMALWDPWERMLFMREGFGVTVSSPMPGSFLVPEPAKTLFKAPVAVRVGPAGVRVLVHEYLWWWW